MSKLTHCFAIALALNSFSSFASFNKALDLDQAVEEATVDEANYFKIVGDMFTTGTVPDLRKISDVAWAGRCFMATAPAAPIAAGYIFRQKAAEPTPDVGPIAVPTSPVVSFEAASYWSPSNPAGYYDEMNLEEVMRSSNFTFGSISHKYGSLVMKSEDLTSLLRVSKEYIVEELRSDVSKPETAAIRCYYFKPKYK